MPAHSYLGGAICCHGNAYRHVEATKAHVRAQDNPRGDLVPAQATKYIRLGLLVRLSAKDILLENSLHTSAQLGTDPRLSNCEISGAWRKTKLPQGRAGRPESCVPQAPALVQEVPLDQPRAPVLLPSA